jgi:hypothetical protein
MLLFLSTGVGAIISLVHHGTVAFPGFSCWGNSHEQSDSRWVRIKRWL